jgi:membrane protein
MAHAIPVSQLLPVGETMNLRSSTRKKFTAIWKLGGLTPWLLARNVASEIRANNFLGRASELAFDFLFALFPLILFMVTLFGLFTSRSLELQDDFLAYFADFLPPIAFQLLRRTTVELAADAGDGMLTFGMVTALWFASGGVNSMISALNLAYCIQEARSWIRVRMVALGLTLSISILLLAALFMVLVSNHFVDWLGTKLQLWPIVAVIWKTFQWPAAIFFVLASYSLIYFFGPNLKERHWYWITPGSVFGAFVWLVASIGFKTYLRFFDSYSLSYGSLGAVMILLAWLYVTGLAFLIGGEINAVIDRAVMNERSGRNQT